MAKYSGFLDRVKDNPNPFYWFLVWPFRLLMSWNLSNRKNPTLYRIIKWGLQLIAFSMCVLAAVIYFFGRNKNLVQFFG